MPIAPGSARGNLELEWDAGCSYAVLLAVNLSHSSGFVILKSQTLVEVGSAALGSAALGSVP